jgi:hypothetical protein
MNYKIWEDKFHYLVIEQMVFHNRPILLCYYYGMGIAFSQVNEDDPFSMTFSIPVEKCPEGEEYREEQKCTGKTIPVLSI